MERAEHRNRGTNVMMEPVDWQVVQGRRAGPLPRYGADEAAEIESFPVMIRLGQIQGQLAVLTQRVERMSRVLEQVEREYGEGGTARLSPRHADDDNPVVPYGITARPNPMTHPLTPLNSAVIPENNRDDALAGVRALFAARRRPWWQRLPDILRG